MKEYLVGRNEAGQRLDKFLAKCLPEAGRGFLYKMLRKKNITLNDRKCEGQEKLAEGDRVRFWLSDETFEKFSGGQDRRVAAAARDSLSKEPDRLLSLIIHEGEEVLILNKPAGMLSQKAAAGDVSANEYLIHHLLCTGGITEEQLKTFRPAAVNRLDRNTSGLLLAGKTLSALQSLSEVLRDRSIGKYYLAAVSGRIDSPAEISGYLKKDEASNRVTVTGAQEDPESRPIRTAYEPLFCEEDLTLLRIHLITGRTHQIRAHLSSCGHPLLGDPKYGDPRVNEDMRNKAGVRSQMLHAFELQFPDREDLPPEVRGKTFRAEPPKPFYQLFPQLRELIGRTQE